MVRGCQNYTYALTLNFSQQQNLGKEKQNLGEKILKWNPSHNINTTPNYSLKSWRCYTWLPSHGPLQNFRLVMCEIPIFSLFAMKSTFWTGQISLKLCEILPEKKRGGSHKYIRKKWTSLHFRWKKWTLVSDF